MSKKWQTPCRICFAGGGNRIILACNTSHLFLPQIYEVMPELEGRVVHIIKNCVEKISNDGIQRIYLLGSEGTIDSKIYQNALEEKGIICHVPELEEYSFLRECIEAVKQNQYPEKVKKIFLDLVNRYDACILGCTELPILYEKYVDKVKCKYIYDPLLLGLQKLKKEYDDE